MKNFVQPGNSLTLTAPYALTGGQAAQVGTIVGVAVADAASGAEVVLSRHGVFSLTKATGQAWTLGAALYWDNTARAVTTTASGNKLIGAAAAAALSADTAGLVLLDGAVRA